MDDALATRSGPRSVGATLRALDSVSIALGVFAYFLSRFCLEPVIVQWYAREFMCA